MTNMKEIFSAAVIQRRVEEMAARIDELYKGESVVAVCVLKGAFPFFSDLSESRALAKIKGMPFFFA